MATSPEQVKIVPELAEKSILDDDDDDDDGRGAVIKW